MTRSLFPALLLSLFALLSSSVAAQEASTDLALSFGPIERIEFTSDIAHSFVTLRNQSSIDVANVTVDIELRGELAVYLGGQSTSNWTCASQITPYGLRCSTPLIRAGETSILQVYVGPVFQTSVELSGRASWTANGNFRYTEITRRIGSFPREVLVTNSGDSGPGSLRAAIEYVNDACTRDYIACRINFHITEPVPQRGWYSIVPNTPFPAITAPLIEVDGGTQTSFTGDTNPLGPEIELDGSALAAGHGLQLTDNGLATISNLAIGGFPWDGIAISRRSWGHSVVEGNYIGTDPTGRQAFPNGSRGITIESAANVDVLHNIISGNRRSGVFITNAYGTTIAENRIGIGGDGVPLPNGASGIFVGPQSGDVRIERNTIAHNATFGVAVSPEVGRFVLADNSISRNGFIGIDRGLDGFSGYEWDESSLDNARIPPPHLLSAIYDPLTDTTTIGGTYFNATDQWGNWSLDLFRNTVNDGQGELVLGHTKAENGTFTFTVPGDLRGQFITATGQRKNFLGLSGDWFWTSEFSEAIEVR